jgi:nucleoid-associated protein YgaU
VAKSERTGATMFGIKTVAEPEIHFRAHFADGAAIVTEGYAGWRVIDRPRDVGLVEWSGRNPMAIEIPFILDYWDEEVRDDPGERCEEQVTRLERLCGLGGHTQPPICKVDGRGMIPHDYTITPELNWVVEQVQWDRDMELRSTGSGRRVRCGGSITIRQFLDPMPFLRRITSRSRAVKPSKYTVKTNDTLSKIAAKESIYGDANKWKLIADANGIRDPRNLKAGKVLKIPR